MLFGQELLERSPHDWITDTDDKQQEPGSALETSCVKAIHTYTYQGFLNMVKASELGISRHRPVISKQQQNNNQLLTRSTYLCISDTATIKRHPLWADLPICLDNNLSTNTNNEAKLPSSAPSATKHQTPCLQWAADITKH
jgi:hypothetical protein